MELASAGNRPTRLAKFRYTAVELLGALCLLIILSPFVEDLPQGDLLEAGLITLVMGLAVLSVGGRRRALVIALLLLTPTLTAKWLNHLAPNKVLTEIYLACSILFFGFVISQLLRFILRAARVDANVLCAGMAGYIMVGLAWTPAYLLVARLNPSAFALSATVEAGQPLAPFTAFYFSFITLTTVGYGDVTPVSKVARMLAVMEAITGVLYMAVLISRLVSVYSSPVPAPTESQPSAQE